MQSDIKSPKHDKMCKVSKEKKNPPRPALQQNNGCKTNSLSDSEQMQPLTYRLLSLKKLNMHVEVLNMSIIHMFYPPVTLDSCEHVTLQH